MRQRFVIDSEIRVRESRKGRIFAKCAASLFTMFRIRRRATPQCAHGVRLHASVSSRFTCIRKLHVGFAPTPLFPYFAAGCHTFDLKIATAVSRPRNDKISS